MFETGIPDFDRMLGGGIPTGDAVLLVGPAGSGKTTLACQLAFRAASAGNKVVYVSTLTEPPSRLIRHLRPFTFFDESQLGKHVVLLQLYPLVKEGLDRTLDALIAAVKEYQASILILDGLETVSDLHPGTAELSIFLYELVVALSAQDCTTILTSISYPGMVRAGAPELTMSDCIVLLRQRNVGTQTLRTIQLQKVRGQSPLLGVHSLRIDRDGVRVFPRVESIIRPPAAGLSQERLSLGLPELDAMTAGGLLQGSVSLLAGAPGTGKTLLNLQYLLAGAQRGEKGLLLGFREAPALLIDKMRGFGMDLATPLQKGLIRISHHVPIDLLVDEVFDTLRRELTSFAPRRLAVDSLAEIEQTLANKRRRRTVLACFTELLRGYGVTALVAREMSQGTGPELEFSDSALASLAENVVLLRYVEFGGELYRILSILKMRDTAHDRTIRQYEITRQGLKVLGHQESAEGLLAGIARLPSELRVKRPTADPGER